MRIISQDGRIDIPYDYAVLTVERYMSIDANMEPVDGFAIHAKVFNDKYIMARYADKENCFDMLDAVYEAAERGVGTIQYPAENDLIKYKEEHRGDENCS